MTLTQLIQYVINNTKKEDLPQYLSLNIQIESEDENEKKKFLILL